MTDWEIKDGVWTEVKGDTTLPKSFYAETDVTAAFEKQEGCSIPIVSPACSVPYSTPSSEWWEGLDFVASADEMLAGMEYHIADRTFPTVGKCSVCPAGPPYKTYAVGIEATREMVEDGFINENTIEEVAEKYLILSLTKKVIEEFDKTEGLLYWRHKPEVDRQHNDWDKYAWFGYMRFVICVPGEWK